jgi:serine/threonine-protein phosphatase 2A regulatory subunit A
MCRRDLFPHYRQLLQDKDPDVRGPACQALATVCKHLDMNVITQSVRPCLLELSKDSSDRVRELLANHLIELAPIFGRQHTLQLLLEPMLTLLRDKTPDVRSVLRSCSGCRVKAHRS